MFQYIAVDLDGTLLNSKGQVSQFTKNVIMSIHKKGVLFIFASGRHYREILPIIQDVGIQSRYYVIACDGQYIYDDKHMLIHVVDYLRIQDIWRIKKEIRGRYSVISDEKDFFYNQRKSFFQFVYDVQQYFELKKVDVEKIIIPGQKSFSKELSEKYTIYRLNDRVEIKNKVVNKLAAILCIGQRIKIDSDKLLYFGDELNDIECFEKLPHCIAPQNAIERIRAIAESVIDSNDDDGVAKMLAAVFL